MSLHYLWMLAGTIIGGTSKLVYMAIDRAHLVLTAWVEHGHTTIVYLYLSCVGAKITAQSLSKGHQLVLWRSAIAIKSTVDPWDVL